MASRPECLDDLEISQEDGRPAIVTVPSSAAGRHAPDWISVRRPALRAALDRYGAVLLRGLAATTMDHFAAARDALIDEPFTYREKATPRSDLGQGVYSSTDLPPGHDIKLHNENSYALKFAGILLFGCITPPATGGATPVADTREVLAALPADLVERFRGIGYTLYRNYHPHLGLPWSTALGTDSKEAVEEFCRANVIAWRWQPDGGLVTSQRRPALIRHPRTGDELWFNHIAFWNEYTLSADVRDVLVSSYGPQGLPFNTAYGDGTPIGPGETAELNRAYQAALRREPWQAGDLLLLDNMLSCHGRDSFSGARKIVVSMGQPMHIGQVTPSSAVEPGPLPA